MAVDVMAVDLSTLGDTFKKVTQHMKVSSHDPARRNCMAAAAAAAGGEGGTSRPGPSLYCMHAPRLTSAHAAHPLQGCFPVWEELMDKGQRLSRSFE